MNNAARIAVVASAFSALAAIACTPAPEDVVSVDVQQGTVDPNCIKGGLGCAPTGGLSTTSSGGTKGDVGGFTSSSGMVLDPVTTSSGGTTVPPKGYPPLGCGDFCKPKYSDEGEFEGCSCSGVGLGLASTIQCPTFAQCPRNLYGVVRCYPLRPDGTCNYP